MNKQNNGGWPISVDTGGTFTDVVVTDAEGRFTIGKTPPQLSIEFLSDSALP